jgi:LPXTG-motif cell wall-anchored protein
MSLTRRLAAGLPAVGVIALAALAFAGPPASASEGAGAVGARQPAAMSTPCAADSRAKCDDAGKDGYGGTGNETEAPDDRGNPGYGGESPTPGTSTTPTGGTDTVPPTTVPPTGTTETLPPGGVSPTTAGTQGGGVSAGELPLTGAPVSATITVGAVLVAGGMAAVWYTRRRREA